MSYSSALKTSYKYLIRSACTGFALNGNFRYFTGYDQHILSRKGKTNQISVRLSFCLTGSQEEEGGGGGGDARASVCVCVCVFCVYLCGFFSRA